MSSATATAHNNTHQKVAPLVIQPKWQNTPTPEQLSAYRRDEHMYVSEGFSVPHESACVGISREQFLTMYSARFHANSLVQSDEQFSGAHMDLVNSMKTTGCVLPREGTTSDGKSGDELGLHPGSAARKHLPEFDSETLQSLIPMFETPATSEHPYAVLNLDSKGYVIGMNLLTYTTKNPKYDLASDAIQSWCYFSFKNTVVHTHGPRKTDDSYMCLDGDQLKWCYIPSGEGEPSRYLVGSTRELKPDKTQSLGNLYATSKDAFQTVQTGIFLGKQGLNILKKGGDNLPIQEQFMIGLEELAERDSSLHDADFYYKELERLVDQARAAVEA